MLNAMYPLLRDLLFLLPPEVSHHLSLVALNSVRGFPFWPPAALRHQPCQVMGLSFPNRVGLAAGMDKNADYLPGLGALGFGFIELGTVTPLAQPGNPKPRLFRLPQAKAIINRMGFNNLGIEHLLAQIQKHRQAQCLLGVNLGKNLTTPVEKAYQDYLIGMQRAYPLADYLAVNLSSPNTPGLRTLQHGEFLSSLLNQLKKAHIELQEKYQRQVPLTVKIAPDLTDQQLHETIQCLREYHIDGVIATNTTVSRNNVVGLAHATEEGGLSGTPLRDASTTIIRKIRQIVNADELPIIAVGGIMNSQDALEKLDAGANLVQIYSGFIYHGPGLIQQILQATQQWEGKHSRPLRM